ncbi:MAG TPA: BBE domain-containing protein [Euzebyales bacterium]|nr:BBE domain-containing protein [Euzebyales bacterium]
MTKPSNSEISVKPTRSRNRWDARSEGSGRSECDENRDAELFSASRGAGGGQFGIVTSLLFATVSALAVTTFHLRWGAAHAAAVVAAWQDWAPVGPEELAASLLITATGEVEASRSGGGRRRGNRPLEAHVLGAMLAGGPAAAGELDGLIARVGVDPEADTGEARVLDLSPWGCVQPCPPDATAFTHRDELFPAQALGDDRRCRDGRRTEAARRWRSRSSASVRPWESGGAYPNVPTRTHRLAACVPRRQHERLQHVKARYDPAELFHVLQSIAHPGRE